MHLNLIKHNFPSNKYSIPILLRRSIPLACVMALLLTIISSEKSYAVNPCAILGDPPSGYTKVQDNTDTGCHFEPILTTPKSSASFTIDDGETAVYDKVVASYGQTNYSSHTVNVTADGIDNYTLILSGVKLTGPSEIRGVSSTSGATLPDNSWGYAWGRVDSDEDNLTYNSATTANLAENNLVNNSLDFSRKLVFATKFNEGVDPGVYKATATLSFTATPSTVVTWNELVYMQDMTAYACEHASTFASKKLIDIRDNNEYTVTKLEDGKCWMTDNLALTKESLKTGLSAITKYDSDVEYDFILPVSATKETLPDSNFGSDNFAAIYSPTLEDEKWQHSYGALYSWPAATAGYGEDSNFISGDAPVSLCPSSWGLPSGDQYDHFFVVTGISQLETVLEQIDALRVEPYNFTPAGYVLSTKTYGIGRDGDYWTSTVSSEQDAIGFFTRANLDKPLTGINGAYRKYGFSVRCIVR